ncbi:MAG: hypothetical protein AAB501_00160 [Patescibacteria group bacterium]
MTWRIDFSVDAIKFIKKNNLEEILIIDKIKLAVRKFRGEDININIKKLSSSWDGFYRIRSGKLRIVVEFQFENFRAQVEVIDWRGSAYK